MSVLTSVTLSGTKNKRKEGKKAIRKLNLLVQGKGLVVLHGRFSCQAPLWWALSKLASCSLLCPEQWPILSLLIGQINLWCSSAPFHAYTEDEYALHSQTIHIYKLYVSTWYITWYRATHFQYRGKPWCFETPFNLKSLCVSQPDKQPSNVPAVSGNPGFVTASGLSVCKKNQYSDCLSLPSCLLLS